MIRQRFRLLVLMGPIWRYRIAYPLSLVMTGGLAFVQKHPIYLWGAAGIALAAVIGYVVSIDCPICRKPVGVRSWATLKGTQKFNRYAYRLNAPSHCESCGHDLSRP